MIHDDENMEDTAEKWFRSNMNDNESLKITSGTIYYKRIELGVFSRIQIDFPTRTMRMLGTKTLYLVLKDMLEYMRKEAGND